MTKNLYQILILTLIIGLFLVTCKESPQESIISPTDSTLGITCGQVITANTTLTEDLECSPDTPAAIIIGASNITLDLGGHTISSSVVNDFNSAVSAENVNGITIKNGTIEGFLTGIILRNTNNVTVENLTIRNFDITTTDIFIFGVVVQQSQNFIVQDCLFEFPPVAHKEAITAYSSSIAVSNIAVNGGGCGVNFSFAGDCETEYGLGGVSGTVFNSKFTDVSISGVLVQCTDNVQISGNEFIRNEVGIQAYGPSLGSITGLTVDGNYIHDGYIGIDFMGVMESIITNNIIKDGWRGIMMSQDMECKMGGPVDQCFYSTANLISNNEVTGHIIDLFHHEKAVGNTWEGNTCITKEGAEIPECNTGI